MEKTMARSVADVPLTFSRPIKLRRLDETGGTIRYQEVDRNGEFIPNSDDGVVGTFYVRKSALGDANPPEFLSIFIVRD
jgi:hypothetical protein